MTFDATSRELCTVRRVRTNTPLQALTMLNDEAFFEAARALADRMMREGGDRARDRATLGFRLVTSRTPTAPEVDRVVASYEKQLAHFEADPAAPHERCRWQVIAGHGGPDDRAGPSETRAARRQSPVGPEQLNAPHGPWWRTRC